MLALRKLLKGAIIVLLCFFTWVTIRMSGYILSDFPNDNLHFVPKNANFAIRLDGRVLGENVLFSLLLNSKDEELIDLLKARREDISGSQNSLSGVNPLSDVVLFSVKIEGTNYMGALFNLLDHKKFSAEMPEKIGTHAAIAVKENVGLILFNKTTSSGKIQKIAANYFNDNAQFDHHYFEMESTDQQFGDIHLHDGDASNEHEIAMALMEDGQSFNVKGTYDSKHAISTSSSPYFLKPEGFHFSNYMLPVHWADSIDQAIQSLVSVQLPPIKALSLNYRGIDIINHPSGFVPLPDMDLVVELQDTFGVQNFIRAYVEQHNFQCTVEDHWLEIEGKRMYFKQLGPNTIYFGRKENPNFIKSDETTLVKVKGSLAPINKIQGGGFMTGLLAITPAFQASKTLSDRTEYVDFEIKKISAKHAKISGEMKFKEGNSPINELMRFLLVSSN